MKASNTLKALLVGLSVLLTASAFAANKGALEVTDPVSVAGKQLAPGNYTVKWDGAGPTVEVSIMKGNKVVATTSARVVDVDRSLDHDSAMVRANGDGSRSLSEIRFSGKKFVLAIGDETAGSSGNGGSSGSAR